MKNNIDEHYMRLCMNLARKGIKKVNPNPMVGCIIVKNGSVVGKGYHKYFGGPHAEVYALKQAGKNAKNATMYVNLEPCCHINKKTPPCVPQIIDSGIKTAVVAMKDPNPDVNGRGINRLKAEGIRCKEGILESQAKELNKVYIKNITAKLPYVILKTAISLDGKIATHTGNSKWITSAESRDYVHHLRSQVDGILVGINTVLKDNPSLTTHGRGENPARIIIDPYLRIPDSNVLNAIIVTNPLILKASIRGLVLRKISSRPKHRENLKVKLELLQEKGAEFIFLPFMEKKINTKIIDFKQIMKKLFKMSIYSVLIEGGGETNAYALNSGIVDEILCFIAPKIIGGAQAKTSVEGIGVSNVAEALKVNKMTVSNIGPDILLRGYINK